MVKKETAKNQKNQKNGLEGIGGWLLVYVIILGFGLLSSASYLIQQWLYVLNVGGVTDIGFIVLVLNSIGFLFGLNSIFLIMQQSKNAPKWTIIAIGVNWLISLIVQILVNPNIIDAGFEILIITIVSIILSCYFYLSRRVFNTFSKKN